MSIFNDILSSVEDGNSLTPEQYEVLADSSEAETIDAVGHDGAVVIETAYHDYVVNNVLDHKEG